MRLDSFRRKKSHKVVVLKSSSNVWSKCADANFHMNFVICVSTAKYVALPLLILPGKSPNRDNIEGYYIEGDTIKK